MSIREFELFHGAVLTKLVRSDRPVTLRMIETRPSEAWSTYVINNELRLLVKHSASPRKLKRERRGARSWTFVFSRDQLRQLEKPHVWVALVCGAHRFPRSRMEVCLIDPTEVAELIDQAADTQQSVIVRYLGPRKSLRVSSTKVDELVVARNRVEKWEIPGS